MAQLAAGSAAGKSWWLGSGTLANQNRHVTSPTELGVPQNTPQSLSYVPTEQTTRTLVMTSTLQSNRSYSTT